MSRCIRFECVTMRWIVKINNTCDFHDTFITTPLNESVNDSMTNRNVKPVYISNSNDICVGVAELF